MGMTWGLLLDGDYHIGLFPWQLRVEIKNGMGVPHFAAICPAMRVALPRITSRASRLQAIKVGALPSSSSAPRVGAPPSIEGTSGQLASITDEVAPKLALTATSDFARSPQAVRQPVTTLNVEEDT
jgi:hypothetical protein